jgi:CRP-like cAMP-binding protein
LFGKDVELPNNEGSRKPLGRMIRVMSDRSLEEELIEQYVQDGNTETAVKMLYDLIVKHARQKDFSKAEALRQKLFEVDPMALTEIIKTAEIIEEEKIVSIDVGHKELWAGLYNLLTPEESGLLYFAMKQAAFDPDQAIFQQGQLSPRLYFINHGELKLTCRDKDREALLGSLTVGDIVGDDHFFVNSVCTTSLIAISSVRLHYLEREVLMVWEKEYPLLYSKLRDFCKKDSKAHEFLRHYRVDRRTQRRIAISGKCQIQILSAAGAVMGRPFYGELNDLSVGGLSFLVRITKKETAHMLLGRRVKLVFDVRAGASERTIEPEGTIVAVRDRAFDDCSIHIRFSALLSEQFIVATE